MADSDLLEKVDEETTTSSGDGDDETFSHYVPKDKLLQAQLTGSAAQAICGKMWSPNKDATKFPICPACIEIYNTLRDE